MRPTFPANNLSDSGTGNLKHAGKLQLCVFTQEAGKTISGYDADCNKLYALDKRNCNTGV